MSFAIYLEHFAYLHIIFVFYFKGFCDSKDTGSYADPNDCSKYWLCAGGKKYETVCPAGLMYNSIISSCDDPIVAKNQIALTCKHSLSTSAVTSEQKQLARDEHQLVAGRQLLNNIDEQTTSPQDMVCLLYTSPSPRDATLSRMPSSA